MILISTAIINGTVIAKSPSTGLNLNSPSIVANIATATISHQSVNRRGLIAHSNPRSGPSIAPRIAPTTSDPGISKPVAMNAVSGYKKSNENIHAITTTGPLTAPAIKP